MICFNNLFLLCFNLQAIPAWLSAACVLLCFKPCMTKAKSLWQSFKFAVIRDTLTWMTLKNYFLIRSHFFNCMSLDFNLGRCNYVCKNWPISGCCILEHEWGSTGWWASLCIMDFILSSSYQRLDAAETRTLWNWCQLSTLDGTVDWALHDGKPIRSKVFLSHLLTAELVLNEA